MVVQKQEKKDDSFFVRNKTTMYANTRSQVHSWSDFYFSLKTFYRISDLGSWLASGYVKLWKYPFDDETKLLFHFSNLNNKYMDRKEKGEN